MKIAPPVPELLQLLRSYSNCSGVTPTAPESHHLLRSYSMQACKHVYNKHYIDYLIGKKKFSDFSHFLPTKLFADFFIPTNISTDFIYTDSFFHF